METRLDDELVGEYLAECREHLADIEIDLLAIEKNGAEIDEQLVNRVFRAAHSIKGGAGFFDLTTIRELAHKTENVLDLIRSSQMTPTADVVSILLLAFDKLRELIGSYRESNGADIAEFVESLTALAIDHLPDNQKGSVNEQVSIPRNSPGRLIEVSKFDLERARMGGKWIYLVEFDLILDVQKAGKTPLAVLNKLMKCGIILETIFDLESAGSLDEEPSGRLVIEVLYATVLEADLIGELVGATPDRIHVIEKDGSSRSLAPVQGPASVVPVVKEAKVATVAKVASIEKVEKAEQVENAQKVEKAAKDKTVPPRPVPVGAAPSSPAETTTVRLNVTLLDSLMTLVGELVLGRNQLNEALSRHDERAIRAGAQRVSMVTSELQEVVTMTRMQPVGGLFSKFPRLVRDLAKSLGKEVHLELEGEDVEIDKTILEGLSDPLTHMVRNAVDHGIEIPEKRKAAGKLVCGVVTLKAYHQAGQVVIEVGDDGRGLDPEKVAASSIEKGLVTREQVQAMSDRDKAALIFLPGVSTAEKVSDVSGRGVGMDVVKTNLDKLGGKVEIDTRPGKGASFKIKLPLTLAIIPSLLVSSGGKRFAIPQANVGELIRIPAREVANRVDVAGKAEILLLRDRLVPLADLAVALGHPRLERGQTPMNVVLVDTGGFEYGLVVEELHDTIEIVVKPLGRHFQTLREYAGATVLGDGRLAVILDVSGIAERAGLSRNQLESAGKSSAEEAGVAQESHSLLLFYNGPQEPCAVPLGLVSRIESVTPAQVSWLAGRRIMQYGNAVLPLVCLHDAGSSAELQEDQPWTVIVFECAEIKVGLLAAGPLDMLEAMDFTIDSSTLRATGIAGSAIVKGRTSLVLDLLELARNARPDLFARALPKGTPEGAFAARSERSTVLVAEDSDFFRGQIQQLIEAVGYRVLAATDGQAAWELLLQHPSEVAVVTTDVEMPGMDGLALARKIRSDERFRNLPIIALSSLAGEEEIARGIEAGIDQYQIKLNPEELVGAIRKMTGSARSEMTK